MTDVLLPSQRRYCMSRIRGKDTKLEMIVRRTAHALGFRFRLHLRALPGTPDLVFPKLRAVVFVHGCFWHMHHCRLGRVVPKTNAKFWADNRRGTVARDARNRRLLRRLGWRTLIVWQCQTRDADRLRRRLHAFLQAPRQAVTSTA